MPARTITAAPPLVAPTRSEAFVEDILDLVDPPPGPAPWRAVRWLMVLAPLAVLLLGVAAAVLPPAH